MFRKRMDAARTISDHLLAAEAAIDEAVAKVATLAAVMPAQRIAANIAAEVGHDALEGAMSACQALVDARARIVVTHQALAQARDAMRLSPKAFGPLPGKPEKDEGGGTPPPPNGILSLVGTKAA